MDTEPTITLHCFRRDGKRERTKLAHQTLADARVLAKWVLQAGNGFYTEIDICTEHGTIETIQNPATTSLVGTTEEVTRNHLARR
jgi:hypothetical protein